MGGRPSIGTLFPPAGNVCDLPGTARLLEELGIDELWVAEDCFMHTRQRAGDLDQRLEEREVPPA
jgi:hypothetical protein